jgi:hypothetical protein
MDRVATGPVEKVRNRLLRRVDWRFLLNDPAPALTACFARGRLREGVSAISGSLADVTQPTRTCDLAVAVDPTGSTTEQLFTALRPGGTAYTEWYGPTRPRSIRRRLRGAGFEDIRIYWAMPWLGSTRTTAWIPIDDARVISYYLARYPRSRSALRRVLQRLAKVVGAAALHTFAYPLCTVARKPSKGSSPQSGRLDYRTMSWLLLTGGPRSISKPVGIGFDRLSPDPRIALKMARIPEAHAGLLREASTLRHVARIRPDLDHIPRVIFVDETAAGPRLGETPMSGVPLSVVLTNKNLSTYAERISGWLFSLASAGDTTPSRDWWGRIAEPALDEFEATYGSVIGQYRMSRARTMIGRLEGLPIVPEHRDFGPWNILVDGDRIAVLDWESSEALGLPLLDLVYFLTYAALYVEGAIANGRYLHAYRRSLRLDTSTGRVSMRCLERYVARLGLSADVIRPLRLLTWTIHARSEHVRLREDVGGPPGGPALAQAMFAAFWRHDVGPD